MLIVTVDFATTEPDTALRLLHADTARVRGLPGNLAFDVLRDAASPDRIVLVQRWADATSFDGHRQADGLKALGAQLFPLMSGTPVTSVFEGSPIST